MRGIDAGFAVMLYVTPLRKIELAAQMALMDLEQLGSVVAPRMKRMAPSASAAAGQKAREIVASGKSLVNLTVGEPDFETPEHIRFAAMQAICRGDTRYTTVTGTTALKNAIAGKFQRENGLTYAADEIIVGSGAKHLIFNAMLASVSLGDEVIVPAPYWVSYPEIVRFVGGTPVLLLPQSDAGLKVSAAQIAAAITPKTKWIILNSPSNPSGAVFSRDELQAIADVLLEHPQVHVLSDDIYEHIIYTDEDFRTIAQVEPRLKDRVITINGVSKSYCMTGWRIGFAGGPKALIREMGKLQSQSTGNPSSISQAAAVAALEGPQGSITRSRAEYRARRDFVCEQMDAIAGLTCTPPDGAFYLFPECSELIGRKTPGGVVILDGDALALHFLDYGVAVIGGTAYGMPTHFRLSIATSLSELAEGCRRMNAACADLS